MIESKYIEQVVDFWTRDVMNITVPNGTNKESSAKEWQKKGLIKSIRAMLKGTTWISIDDPPCAESWFLLKKGEMVCDAFYSLYPIPHWLISGDGDFTNPEYWSPRIK